MMASLLRHLWQSLGLMLLAFSMLSNSVCLASFHLSEEKAFLVFQSMAAVGGLVSTSSIPTSQCDALRCLSSSFKAASVSGGGKMLIKQNWGLAMNRNFTSYKYFLEENVYQDS